jgi:hypothetical protein
MCRVAHLDFSIAYAASAASSFSAVFGTFGTTELLEAISQQAFSRGYKSALLGTSESGTQILGVVLS